MAMFVWPRGAGNIRLLGSSAAAYASMSTRVPPSPESDKTDAALLSISDAVVV
jgi:hypothetical protein